MLNKHAQAFADFGLFAFRCEDLDPLLHRACELVSEALETTYAKVLEHLPQQGKLLVRSGVNWQPGVVGHETIGDHAKSPGGYALKTDAPVVSPDLATEDRFVTPELLHRHGVKSMVNVVIIGESAPFGVLEVDAREPHDFTEDEVAFLTMYANLLAAAIERIRIQDELRRAAREQAVLAQELGHRVRNLFGLVRAVASQTSADGRSAEDFRSVFIARLQALSAAESLVFERSDERVDLPTLAHKVLAAYRADNPRQVVIEGPPVTVSARQGRMFGLALHELATNAAKHGALGAPAGQVRVDWQVNQPNEHTREVSLTWQEADGPQVSPPTRKGFGTRLLQDVVAHELNGTAELVYDTSGLRYHVSFVADEK